LRKVDYKADDVVDDSRDVLLEEVRLKAIKAPCEAFGEELERMLPLLVPTVLGPNDADAHDHLGNTLRKVGRLAKSVACHSKAISIRPNKVHHEHLAAELTDIGQQDHAVEHLGKALRFDRGDTRLHSDLLFTMLYQSGLAPQELFAMSVDWSKQLETPLEHTASRRPCDRRDGGRLRIGYVLPDFREHAVSRFFEPLLANHNRNAFEIFCYSDTKHSDATTESVRNLASAWRDVSAMPDDGA
jgi:protein O-GlcNAc transferase